MVIVIIGSNNASVKKIEACKKFFTDMGHEVHSPIDNGRKDMHLFTKQTSWIYMIKQADLIVAIPKSVETVSGGTSSFNLEFGESTSYEIAIARYFYKVIIYWGMIDKMSIYGVIGKKDDIITEDNKEEENE